MNTKRCVKCKKVKSINEFTGDKRAFDGKQSRCKKCRNEDEKIRKANNPEEVRKSSREWRKNNQEKIRLDMKKRYNKNPEIAKKRAKKWAKSNPEKRQAIQLNWIVKNPEKRKEVIKKANKKKRSTPKGKLNSNIGKSIWASLHGRKSNQHWEFLVGYTISALKKHIEKQFMDGMSWDNYGEWHLDHKIPISVFNFQSSFDEDFKKCWSLNNLQPLWAKDNIVKRAKLTKHFQPSLIF